MAIGYSVGEILAENYLGIGAIGIQVIETIIDDLATDKFDDEWLSDMGITRDELSCELTSIVTSIITNNNVRSILTPEGWEPVISYA